MDFIFENTFRLAENGHKVQSSLYVPVASFIINVSR